MNNSALRDQAQRGVEPIVRTLMPVREASSAMVSSSATSALNKEAAGLMKAISKALDPTLTTHQTGAAQRSGPQLRFLA